MGGSTVAVINDSVVLYGRVSAAAKVDVEIVDPLYIGAVFQRWGYGPDPANPGGVTSGYLRQYQVTLKTGANAGNIIDSAEFTVALPSGSVFSSLRLDGYGTYVGGTHNPDFNSCVGLGTCNGWTVTSVTGGFKLRLEPATDRRSGIERTRGPPIQPRELDQKPRTGQVTTR